MTKLPLDVKTYGYVTGFGAIYVVILVSCLILLLISCGLLSDGIRKDIAIIISFILFSGFSITGVFIGVYKTELFCVEVRYHITTEKREVKAGFFVKLFAFPPLGVLR